MTAENCYIVDDLDNRTNRVDAHFFNPKYFETIEQMEKYHKDKKNIGFTLIKNLLIKSKTNLTGGATPTGTPYVTEDEGIKFLRVQNVRKYRLDIDNVVYIARPYHEVEIKRSQLKPFDILLTITGVTYGFSAMVPADFGEANINQHCVKMEVDSNKIYPEYLCCFLNCFLAKVQMDRLVTGGTRPALDYPSIKLINVLFPKSIDNQQIIAEKTMKIVNEAYNRFNKKQEMLSDLDNTIINSLQMKLPDKKEEKYFIGDISNGDRIDAIFYSPFYKKFLELIRKHPHKPLKKLVKPAKKITPDIQEFYSVLDQRGIEEKTGRCTVKELTDISSNKVVLQKGNIFVSCLNPTKGKSLFVDDKLDGYIVSTEFKPLQIISDEILPEYLIAILRSNIALTQWKYMITGSTPSRARIGENELYNTLIPVPEDKSLQEDIAEKVFADIKEISLLEQEFYNYLEKADNTFLDELNTVT